MGKYQAYPEYKGSGVEWLRKVPTHWKVISLKYCVEKIIDNRGRTPPTTDSGIPLLEAKQMGGESIYSQNNFDKYISEEAYSAFIRDDVIENDILFVTVGTVGKTNLVPKDAKYVIAQNIVGLRVRSYMNPLYFLFYLRSNEIKAEMSATNKDSILDSIKISDFIQSNICIPDLIEQQKIANFLDHEIAKIDTLIEQQQQLIQLLKEKRQAVISHAVTKGLSSLNGGPNAPMKDSGVEWLGEVPAHWVVCAIKYVLSSQNSRRIPLSSEDRGMRSGDFRYYGASGVIDYIDDFIFDDESNVLVGEDGANLVSRNTPLAFSAHGQYWVNNHAHILKPKDSLADYWAEVIEHIDVTPIVTGSAQPKLTAEALNNLIIAFPKALDERVAIDQFIKLVKSKYQNLIEKAQQQIALMQERRTALISAAVTGKIDVRHWQAPQQ